MGKDPAFLFYPGDWIAGTMHLDFECKGAYMELLMMQFNRGHMTSHMIGHVLGQRMDIIWPQIQDKFETDGKVFWNVRLKEEKEKRQSYTKSRSNNKKGSNQYSKKKKKERGHMTSHMENENENENKEVNGDEKKDDRPIEKIIDWFKDKIGGSLDGTIYDNEANCLDCLEKIEVDYPNERAADLLFFWIESGLEDDFHKKQMTNFRYIFRNLSKLRLCYEQAERDD